MGLDDRDYMRERYRQRQGVDPGKVQWNDRAARAEATHQNHKKAAPIGGGTGIGGGWFKPKNRNFAPRETCHQPSVVLRAHPVQKWIYLLSALSFLLPAYREIKRAGWLPDWEEAVPFPSSGSVTVNREIDPRTATSRLRVITAEANAVVQLYDASTGVHIISLYVRRDDEVVVPVPPGTYRVKLVEGDKWHGRSRYFGSSTTSDTVIATMSFSRRLTLGIDLHRRPDGNLPTRPDLFNPKPLR
jgi:hypothetical protein